MSQRRRKSPNADGDAMLSVLSAVAVTGVVRIDDLLKEVAAQGGALDRATVARALKGLTLVDDKLLGEAIEVVCENLRRKGRWPGDSTM